MFKAFYWMFLNPENRKIFIKNSIILYAVFLINILLWYSIMHLVTSGSVFGLMAIVVLPVISFLGLLLYGYFWEMTANIIERKTDIISTNIYGGKVKLTENIKIPKIKFFKFIWRGFAGSVATFIMELPVILIATNMVLFKKPEWLIVVIVVQVLIGFFYPGLAWNYAKSNSVFSMLNIYVAGELLESKPGRYLWNLLLTIITWSIFIIFAYILEAVIGAPDRIGIDNMQDLTKYIIPSIIYYIPFIYVQHVLAFLTGTIGNSSDY